MSTTINKKEKTSVQNKTNQVDASSLASMFTSKTASVADVWNRSAPGDVVAAWKPESPKEWWQVWTKHLANRSQPQTAGGKKSTRATNWGLANLPDAEPFAAWLAQWESQSGSKTLATQFVSQWIADAERLSMTASADGSFALQCVTFARELPKLAKQLSAETWCQLTDLLVNLAVASQAEVESPAELSVPVASLTHQLLAGELPLTLGFLLPELKAAKPIRKTARQILSHALTELTDGEGMLSGDLLPVAGALFGCWTRCGMIGKELKKGAWSTKAAEQFDWLVRQMVRLNRGDGTILLSPTASESCEWSLWKQALQLDNDPADWAATAMRLPASVLPANKKSLRTKLKQKDLPESSVSSEWAGVALLSTGWDKKAARLAVDYHSNTMQMELVVAGQTLFAGEWGFQIKLAGKLLEPLGTWEEECYHSDEDCDYLELAIELTDGAKLERQILLARTDGMLYIADNVLTEQSESKPIEMQFESTLPLASGFQFTPEKETRDGLLVGKKPCAAVMPLALPEWQADPRLGELSQEKSLLTLRQQRQGVRMCCPLFFDLDPTRCKKQRTWRQLNIAESLEVQGPDVAIGYRAQSGNDQWLVYRSLAPAANRTLIGQNLSCECMIGRFLSSGEVDEFLEIDADDR